MERRSVASDHPHESNRLAASRDLITRSGVNEGIHRYD
jgi:hypothetical protein